MSAANSRYPRTISSGGASFELRVMHALDEPEVLRFARALPQHDLLFMRRDITNAKVLSAWVREIGAENIVSMLARRNGEVVGCAAVVRDLRSFSPHVGDLRVLVAPSAREQGLGRALVQESFLVALSMGLEKITAHMTSDQRAAITVFEDLGFRVEALLRDHVRDASGDKFDIVVLSLDVAAHQAKLELYGLPEAFAASS
jgi:ribosomal protein S18 acetylase RimI-like enzyme